jgi:hypothetical protein
MNTAVVGFVARRSEVLDEVEIGRMKDQEPWKFADVHNTRDHARPSRTRGRLWNKGPWRRNVVELASLVTLWCFFRRL